MIRLDITHDGPTYPKIVLAGCRALSLYCSKNLEASFPFLPVPVFEIHSALPSHPDKATSPVPTPFPKFFPFFGKKQEKIGNGSSRFPPISLPTLSADFPSHSLLFPIGKASFPSRFPTLVQRLRCIMHLTNSIINCKVNFKKAD